MANPDPPGATGAVAPARGSSAAWPLALLGLTIANAAAMRAVFSPMQEIAEHDLQFNDFEISLIQGVAASIPIALLSVPIGRLTDRGHRARLLMALSALWTAGTFGTVFAADFWQMFFARMLAGVGAMCSLTVAISMAADFSAPEQRGRSLLFLSVGNMTGTAAAFALSGALLGWYGTAPPLLANLAPWRSVHLAFGAASAALTLLLVTLREPDRREIGEHSANTGAALRAIWQRRRLLAPLFLGQVTVVMADAAAGIWAAPVLTREFGLQPEQFSGWMGLVILLSGLIGAVLGGVGADLGHRSKMRGGIIVAAVVAAVLSIPGAFFPLMPTILGFALMLALLLTCGAVTGLVTAAAIAVLVPNEIRGVCLGVFIVVGAVIGFGVAPTMVTWVSAAMGGPQALGYGLALTGASTSAIAALGFVVALRSAQRQ
jgi:MFS family permease